MKPGQYVVPATMWSDPEITFYAGADEHLMVRIVTPSGGEMIGRLDTEHSQGLIQFLTEHTPEVHQVVDDVPQQNGHYGVSGLQPPEDWMQGDPWPWGAQG